MSTAKGPVVEDDTILGDIIREAVEMLTKNGMQSVGVASAIVANLRNRFPVGSELALKFAGISVGKMVADAVARLGIVPPAMKAFVVPIIDDVIKGVASGVAESAATPQAAPQEQKPVTAESPKGEMLVAVCPDLPGVHEFADGHLLCPMARASKRQWEKEHPPKQDQKKMQEKGKDGKQRQHFENVEKPGLPYPMEIMPYPLAKRTTADPFCPVCQISAKHEETLAKAEEKKPRKPMDRAKWAEKIGYEGRWLTIVLAGSTTLKQSDFINEATQVPPDLWKDLARTIATRKMNRARKAAGTMIIHLGDPIPEEFYSNADETTLQPDDIEYCIRFLSGFGVTELELPTRAEMALDRVASHIPAETMKKGVKVVVITCLVLGLIGLAALIGILVAISP